MTETLRGREINSAGEKEYFPLDKIAILAQTRRGLNPVHHELVESIDTIGLLYPPLVAKLSREEFANYLQFTHDSLGEDRSIADFGHLICNDMVTLMVDGGSRAAACLDIQKRNLRMPIVLGCIVLDNVTRADDVIALQIAANIHQRPSADDEAHSLAASFELALSRS